MLALSTGFDTGKLVVGPGFYTRPAAMVTPIPYSNWDVLAAGDIPGDVSVETGFLDPLFYAAGDKGGSDVSTSYAELTGGAGFAELTSLSPDLLAMSGYLYFRLVAGPSSKTTVTAEASMTGSITGNVIVTLSPLLAVSGPLAPGQVSAVPAGSPIVLTQLDPGPGTVPVPYYRYLLRVVFSVTGVSTPGSSVRVDISLS